MTFVAQVQAGLFGQNYPVSPYCSECEGLITGKVYKDLDGETLCTTCFEDNGLIVCPSCEETFDRSDCEENPDGNLSCEDCLDNDCFSCDNCQAYAWNNDCVEVKHSRGRYGRSHTDSLCESCADDKTITCSDCNDIIYKDDAIRLVGGDDICDPCYSDRYFTCEDCGEVYHVDDMGSSGRGGCYCFNCSDADYNFSPSGFRNRSGSMTEIGSTRCYGIELETDECNGYSVLENSGAWGAKEDSTVSGKEFYSDILSGDDGLDAVREFSEHADRNNWDAGCSAGYHLHIDMRNESDDSLYAIAYAYRATQGVWQSFVEGRRHGGSYSHEIRWGCADIDAAVRNGRTFYSFAGNGTRYNWCNLCAYLQHSTFEIRLYEGTCDKTEIINWVKAHTRFADWASQLGYAGVKEALDGLDNNEMFLIIVRDVWQDYPLSEYYAEKARKHNHGFLTSSIGCEV